MGTKGRALSKKRKELELPADFSFDRPFIGSFPEKRLKLEDVLQTGQLDVEALNRITEEVTAPIAPYIEKYGEGDPNLAVLVKIAYLSYQSGPTIRLSELKPMLRPEGIIFQSKLNFHLRALEKKGALKWQEGDTTCTLCKIEEAD